VNVEDRGYQFADGVYEVCEVRSGRLVDFSGHIARLKRSLGELRIAVPLAEHGLLIVMREVVRRNRVRDGLVYLQVTRGVSRRDHGFPIHPVPPSLVLTARSVDPAKGAALAGRGIKVISTAENRWPRVDIKSIALLPNVLAKQAAREQGAAEAWYVDADGFVTEGASSNAWIVTAEGRLVTRSTERGILAGITRAGIVKLAEQLQLRLEERPFTVAEAKAAREAFVTAATQIVMPVIAIDGDPVGEGRPGPVTQRLRGEFHRFAELI
jgi:D-alanine transaminase